MLNNKIAIVITCLLLSNVLFGQAKSCCTPASETFSAFAADIAFVNKHPEPEIFHYSEQKGEMIQFNTPDGTTANAYAVIAKEKSNAYIIVFHEWWGLNDYIKQMADKLAEDAGNVHVIAVDMYDGKVAEKREDAQTYMQSLKQERIKAILQGLKAKLGAEAQIATIGWCMGGGLSMQASLVFGKQAKACVMYYGMPENDMERLNTLSAPVMFIHANQDKWITDKVVEFFEKNMQTAGKELIVRRYDADHAFANPSNQKHNAEMAKDAYTNALKFIRKGLNT